MNTRRIPLLLLFIPFAVGVGLGGWLDQPIPNLEYGLIAGFFLLVLLSVYAFPYRYRWVFGLGITPLLLSLGYYRAVSCNELRDDEHFSKHYENARYWVGVVSDAPSLGARLKTPFRVEAAGHHPDSLFPVKGNVMLLIDSMPEDAPIRYGDRMGIKAVFRPTEGPKNPDAFNYARYLHFQNIHYQAFVKSNSMIRLGSGYGHPVWRGAFACREKLLNLLQRHFPTQSEYGVASALLVGYKNDISEELKTAYAETGSMHALAVSGTHVGMLYMGLMFLIQRLPLRGRRGLLAESLLILIAIWAFTFLTGATASVLRASVMFSIYLIGQTFNRSASIWNVMGASAMLLLLYNPWFLFDAGFQLSYCAVGGIVFFYPELYRLSPVLKKGWRDEALKVLLIGVAAQLGTLPLSLYYFHQFPMYFWLAGWIVVLGGAIFMWGGAVLVVLDALCRPLAAWLGKLLYGLVWAMNWCIEGIQQLPACVIGGIWIADWVVPVLYGCLILLGMVFVTKRAVWLLYFLGVMAGLGLYRNVSLLGEKDDQKRMVIYAINKGSLMDFFSGRDVVSISGGNTTDKNVRFAAQTHRWTSGMRFDAQTVQWPIDTFRQVGSLMIQRPIIEFYHRKMALVDTSSWIENYPTSQLPIHVDVLVLSNNPKVNIADCRRVFDFETLVMDGSNSWKNARRWTKECTENGWKYHDVRQQGYWEMRE